MNRTRIALCMEYPLRQWGGVEVLVKELISGLSSQFELLLVSDDTSETLRESAAGSLVFAHFSWSPQRDYKLQAVELAGWLLAQKVDLVHFHLGGTYAMGTRSLTKSPIPIVAASGIPCIATNHGAFSLFDFCAPSRPMFFRLAVLPFFWLGRARTLSALRCEITVSDNDLSNMRRWFFPFSRKFRRIYHSQLVGDEPLNENREKTILCLGTIGIRKGQRYLVEAFVRIAEKFPDWTLLIAGRQDAGGEELAAIQQTLRDAPSLLDRIRLFGAVTNDEARQLVQSCGIFAMPSLAEGLGLSLQEALFSGCPAVASRIGGIQDMVIDGETGVLAEPGDVASLAKALARALDSAADRLRWGCAARKRIEELGMTRGAMIGNQVNLYDCMVAPKSSDKL